MGRWALVFAGGVVVGWFGAILAIRVGGLEGPD